MVVALIALFVTLGGVSYAAIRLPANSVGALQLKSNAVTPAKINANAVTAAKTASNAVQGAKINTNVVSAAKIASNAVTSAKIAASAVTSPKCRRDAGRRRLLGNSLAEVGISGLIGCSGPGQVGPATTQLRRARPDEGAARATRATGVTPTISITSARHPRRIGDNEGD